MLSANHVYPDLGAEIYVLDGPPDHHRLSPEATDATRGSHPTCNRTPTH
jgi:hypothetical protein